MHLNNPARSRSLRVHHSSPPSQVSLAVFIFAALYTATCSGSWASELRDFGREGKTQSTPPIAMTQQPVDSGQTVRNIHNVNPQPARTELSIRTSSKDNIPPVFAQLRNDGERGLPPTKRLPRSALGVNVGQVNYWTEQIVFLDLMKQAPDWGLNSGGRMPDVDLQGWPRSLETGYGAGFNARTPHPGRYVILYDGIGEMTVTHGGKSLNRVPGRTEIHLEGPNSSFTITRTDPKNPMRNVRIVPIENEYDHHEQVFNPRFIQLLEPFSTLRFLDFLRINNSPLTRWSERPKPDDFAQGTDKGVALEYAIELCNRVRADCWINIPHMADDDYISGAALLLREKLDPSLLAYVEYSNEIWNFAQGDWAQKAGERLGMKAEWDTRLRYQARRSTEAFRIFQHIFGRERLVRVLAGQMWTDRLQILLDFEKAYEHADGMAVAPYFCDLASEAAAPVLRTLNPTQVGQRCLESIGIVRQNLLRIHKLSEKYKLPLIAYEGGQHLVTGGALHTDTLLQQLLDRANQDVGMREAYMQYLEMWKNSGGQLMMLYQLCEAPTMWGRWGLVESLRQSPAQAPKYNAALEFLRRQPPWWRRAPGE